MSKAPASQRNWFAVPEAAEYIGVTEKALRQMIYERTIEYRKDGTHRMARLRLSRAVLDAYVAANTVKPR